MLVGTLWILPLAYLVRNLPIASRAVLAGFRRLDPGAGRGGRLARRRALADACAGSTLPLLRPALAAGATLAFVTALGDFVTSIMLYTYDTRPLSLEILASLRQGDVGVAAAYGVVLMLLCAAWSSRSAASGRWSPGESPAAPLPATSSGSSRS